jgi:predicted O-methyltransferase YrrM
MTTSEGGKKLAKRGIRKGIRKGFELGQRVGLDLLPRHFYSSIPSVHQLRATNRWRPPRTLVGVNGIDIQGQLEFARSVVPDHWPQDIHGDACRENGAAGYGPVESNFLYGFVYSKRPRKIVQVGAGISTAIALSAARHAGYEVDIVAVDPYPTQFLRAAAITLIEQDAQDVPLEQLTELGEGDLLFIDSTHTVRADSEVNRLVLEVLPRLRPGVFVHFHDIYFPYDYQRDLLDEALFFWSESTLVHAFLIGNERYRIAAALSMLHYEAPDQLAKLIPAYRPQPNRNGLCAGDGHFPASLYLLAG